MCVCCFFLGERRSLGVFVGVLCGLLFFEEFLMVFWGVKRC